MRTQMPRRSAADRWDDGIGCGFISVVGVILIGNLIFWGVVIWAIIRIVNHQT